jgi:5-methylcytosine-specific restriction endonuclease McrA
MRSTDSLAILSEQQLLTRFGNLVSQDRRHTAQLLATLAEIDQRKLWAKLACPSMFAFCVERFHMSESVTAKRIWAARTARRFPVILQMVARGELHLSAIVRLAKHLTQDNHRGLLRRAKHKTSREVDLLVAELAPQPDVPSRIRALPRATGSVAGSKPRPADACVSQGPGLTVVDCSSAASNGSNIADTRLAPTTPNSPTTALPRGRVIPLAPRRYKIEITVDQQTHDKLRMLEDLLGHQLAGADPAVIVSRAIDRLLDETLKKKAAVTDHPRHSVRPSDPQSRTIPAAIRREVWQRDGGRCTFVDQQGRRCRGRRCMEYHHEQPYGKGGQHEADNLALRCGAHNQYQADLDFGKNFMRNKRHHSSSAHSARHV